MRRVLLISVLTFFLLATSVHALSFYPIKFNIWTGEAVLVDESVEIPVYVQNLGLLPDSYSIKVSVPEEYSDQILIENPSSSTSELKTNDVDNINIRLSLYSDIAPVKILVQSSTAPILKYLEVTSKPKINYWIFYLMTIVLLVIVLILL